MRRKVYFLESIIIGAIAFLILLMIWQLKCFGEPVSEHFRREEFNQASAPLPLDKVIIDPALLEALEDLREAIGQPIVITSGYRSPAYNKKVGGVANSQHIVGKAADIRVSGMTPKALLIIACHYFDFVKLYETHLHVDVRNAKP